MVLPIRAASPTFQQRSWDGCARDHETQRATLRARARLWRNEARAYHRGRVGPASDVGAVRDWPQGRVANAARAASNGRCGERNGKPSYQRHGEESGGGADRLGRIERSGLQNTEFVSRLTTGVATSRGCEAAPVYGKRFRPDWHHPRALTESGRCRCVRIARVRDAKHRTASGSRQKRAMHWPRPDFGCEIKLQILDWHPPRQSNKRRMCIR